MHLVCFQNLVLIQDLGISNKAFPNLSPKQRVCISYPLPVSCGHFHWGRTELEEGGRGLDFPVSTSSVVQFPTTNCLLGSLIGCFKVMQDPVYLYQPFLLYSIIQLIHTHTCLSLASSKAPRGKRRRLQGSAELNQSWCTFCIWLP